MTAELNMDYRIADRRRRVQEDGARRHLRWGVGIVIVATIAGLTILAFRSPLLAVRSIEISGGDHTDVAAVLAQHGVGEGVPTVSVRASAIEEDIERDPWVARANVRVAWPGAIDVVVIEHVPAAWLKVGKDWMLVSGTGVMLERGQPPEGAPRIRVPVKRGRPGDLVDDGAALAALEFVATLPAALSRDAVVRGDAETMRAVVAGHKVLLGAPADMFAKASSLIAVLDTGIEVGARVTVVAPYDVAVSQPQREVEVAKSDSTDTSG